MITLTPDPRWRFEPCEPDGTLQPNRPGEPWPFMARGVRPADAGDVARVEGYGSTQARAMRDAWYEALLIDVDEALDALEAEDEDL